MDEIDALKAARVLGGSCASPAGPADESGLTIREWLAGLAMQGLLCCPPLRRETPETIAGMAVEQADLVLLALARSSVPPAWRDGPSQAAPSATDDEGIELTDQPPF